MAAESASDRSAFFNTDDWAESATYTPPAGSADTVNVIYDRTAPLSGGEHGELVTVNKRQLRALKTEFAVAPVVNGRFVIGSETLRVRAVMDDPDDPSGKIYLILLEIVP